MSKAPRLSFMEPRPQGLSVCVHCKIPQKDINKHKCSMQDYEIEAIENVGYDEDGEMLVLIKWKGYNEKTWEDFNNLNVESYDLLIEWFQINKIVDGTATVNVDSSTDALANN